MVTLIQWIKRVRKKAFHNSKKTPFINSSSKTCFNFHNIWLISSLTRPSLSNYSPSNQKSLCFGQAFKWKQLEECFIHKLLKIRIRIAMSIWPFTTMTNWFEIINSKDWAFSIFLMPRRTIATPLYSRMANLPLKFILAMSSWLSRKSKVVCKKMRPKFRRWLKNFKKLIGSSFNNSQRWEGYWELVKSISRKWTRIFTQYCGLCSLRLWW